MTFSFHRVCFLQCVKLFFGKSFLMMELWKFTQTSYKIQRKKLNNIGEAIAGNLPSSTGITASQASVFLYSSVE